MRLVVTMGIRRLPDNRQPLAELYREFLEESVFAEELGFDAVWASEHHFAPDAWNPSPFTFLTAVAARTARVRIGPYVLLLPLHNPVRVAEDAAVVDNISNGRLDLPVGVGSAPEEFRTFGVPFGERLGRTFEALRIIERCFAGEEFSHKGKYYEFPDLRMTTAPVQEAGPPIWVASMGEQSVAWTARRGYHLAAGAGPGHQRWEELLLRHGHDRAVRQVASVPLRVHLAETHAEAWDEAEAGLHHVLHFYCSRVDPRSATAAAGVLDPLPAVGEFRDVPGIGHRGTPFVVGTPDEAMRALARYRDRRVSHLCLNFHQPGMQTRAVRRAMAMFARELMPAIKAW